MTEEKDLTELIKELSEKFFTDAEITYKPKEQYITIKPKFFTADIAELIELQKIVQEYGMIVQFEGTISMFEPEPEN